MKKFNVSGLMVFDEDAMIEVLTETNSVVSFKIVKKQNEFNYIEEELEIVVDDWVDIDVEDIREIFNEMEFDESFVVTEMEFENSFAKSEMFNAISLAVKKGKISKSDAISRMNDVFETLEMEDLI